MEQFDAVGRFRLRENERPIDSESDFLTLEGDLLRLRGPRDVAELAAGSASARRGFIRQLFQSVIKQAPAAYGHGTLARLEDQFTESGQHIRNVFVEINVLTALHGVDANATASQ